MMHGTCNVGTTDLPDMHALSPQASGMHIRQFPHTHVTTIIYPSPQSLDILYITITNSVSIMSFYYEVLVYFGSLLNLITNHKN